MTEMVDMYEKFSGQAVVPSTRVEMVFSFVGCLWDMLLFMSKFLEHDTGHWSGTGSDQSRSMFSGAILLLDGTWCSHKMS